MNKKLVLFDNNVINKEKLHKTRVEIKDHDTGETLFVGTNKVVLQGSSFIARKLFNLDPVVQFQSYNNALGLDNSDEINKDNVNEIVCLFAAGTDGCGPMNSQVYSVDYTKGITNPIPFRYQLITKENTNNGDLTDELRKKYFGRTVLEGGTRAAYYFKAFETKPELKQQFIDGTPITESVPINNTLTEVETFVRIQLLITKEDFRDYFEVALQDLQSAKVNTISLLTAYPTLKPDGYTYYQNILPLTKINFPNEELADTTKSLDIIYDVFE